MTQWSVDHARTSQVNITINFLRIGRKIAKKKKRWKRRKKRSKKRRTRVKPITDTLGWVSFSVLTLGSLSGGILLLGNKFGLFSLPWVETIGIVFDWGVPIGTFLILFGGSGMVISLKSRKGRIIFPMVGILACLLVGTVFPGVADVLFWRGADGESMEELVKEYGFVIIVGADRHRIWLHNNPKAVDPTFEELLVFLAQDETDQIPYNPGRFVCADYAEMLHNNAEKAGIRAAYVCVRFQSYYIGSNTHAFNAFRTVDKGLVFIDMSSECDCVAYVKIDRPYQLISLFSDVKFLPMGKVAQYKVQW